MSPHCVLQCSCGAVIAQCRCPNPVKPVAIRPHGCPTCQAREAARRLALALKGVPDGDR